jgi:hypothetical protein
LITVDTVVQVNKIAANLTCQRTFRKFWVYIGCDFHNRNGPFITTDSAVRQLNFGHLDFPWKLSGLASKL